MHLGSGNVDESDASLDVLADLVEQHLAAMAPFAIFFKVCQTGFTGVSGLFPTLDWLNFKRALVLFVNSNTRGFTVYTCLCSNFVFHFLWYCSARFCFIYLFVFVCYQVLWPLILFQGHSCVRNMNCK